MSQTIKENRGDRVLKARKATKGMTQGRLAELVGLSQQTIVQIEKHNSTSSKMYKIAEVLQVSINYLETGEAEKTEPNLSLIQNDIDTFTIEEIQNVVAEAFDSTLISTRKSLQRRGNFDGGIIDAVKNKQTIVNILITAMTHKLTGHYMESNILKDQQNKISS
ncbi:MAG: helix-turn-helix transcriptional regulator [Alteromonadaceae bacterium]|nr:helix-turn-helix transcriptional regulator [Alteromonadaceae bacterium]